MSSREDLKRAVEQSKKFTEPVIEASQYQPEVMPEDVAAEKGWVCRYPRENELFLDIDSEQGKDFAIGQIAVYRYLHGVFGLPRQIVTFLFTPSRQKGHYHGVIVLDGPVDHKDRIMLQALLGSDHKHELLSYARLFHPQRKHAPTVFYETDKNLKNEPYDKGPDVKDTPCEEDWVL